ncbi:PASTA domain-containing protein [Microbacterium sp. 4R-513]|uniref:transglycosylase domain-containing protein n=1 Tax=Microbacterium sp. 4R-513 TaxID=2567934 RepID=UPI0013E15BD1|nr:transglycosylase domain-containing protein [Microbacterium sp. 4R-513]QIG39952.1 PASTA domain-containing protein [Microbacterium sp. 4R-513]
MPVKNRTASGVLGGLAGLVGLSAVAGILVTATVTPAIALSGAAASSAITMFDNLPSVLEIEKLMLPTTIYYKDPAGADVELTKFYDQNRSPVAFDQIAPVMYDAILSSEDKNFYKHGGVDLVGTVSAVLDNVRGRDTRGGSSISQQYVKNILVQRCESNATTDEELKNCYVEATTAVGDKGLQRKLQEMRYAIALEQKYSKNEILLGYLNIAGFGGTNYGVDAAARYYFNVAAKDLTLGQSAALAGMVQNPNAYRIDKPNGSTTDKDGNPINSAADGYALTKDRQLYVLDRLLADGKITQEAHDAAVAEPITPVITPPKTGCAAAGEVAYFCQYVKNIIKTDPAFGATPEERQKALQRGGLKIYTTLDMRVQQPAQDIMTKSAPPAIANMEFGSAAVSVEATTGRVLAMVQNKNFSEDQALTQADHAYTSLVYAADQKYGSSSGFAAGSTFKLFTLVDWLEKGHSLNEVLNGRARAFKKVANSCGSPWVNTKNEIVNNFGKAPGFVGTPMQFTAASLNTGFFAMAEKLDLCDIKNVATKMGVTQGNGEEVKMDNLFSVIGSNAVSPLAMAGAFGTVANNGIYCQPKAIDRVTDADGNDLPIPATTCTQVLDPSIAATAAYALQGVMNGSGTGAASNPRDGTPVLGKTGTNEDDQTWMVESSTKVATAVWVGNTTGFASLSKQRFNGTQLSQIRHKIAPVIQRAANSVYGGDRFPQPDQNLTKSILTDLPNVVGLSIDEATAKLKDAGFEVAVGDAIDSSQAEGTVAAQNPGAGKVAGGTTVTINPSNGAGVTVPGDVAGKSVSEAISYLRSLGFGNVQPGACTEEAGVKGNGTATGTNPPGGSVVNRNAQINVDYKSEHCSR